MLNTLALIVLASASVTGCISKQMRALDAASANAPAITVVADRGATLVAPENTLAAFDKAQEQGAVAIQLDVQLSKDGRLVIFRDESLEQKTSLQGPVASHTWQELQPIDFAHWFTLQKRAASATPSPEATPVVESRGKTSGVSVPVRENSKNPRTQLKKRARGSKRKAAPAVLSLSRILTLDDVFEHYGLTFQYFIVLHDGAASAAVIKLVKEYGIGANAVVVSSDTDVLTKLHTSSPSVGLCYLVDETKTKDINGEIQKSIQYGFQYVGIRTAAVTHDHVKRAGTANVKVFAYDPASDEQIVNAVKAGASAVTTAEPGRIAKVIEDASKIKY